MACGNLGFLATAAVITFHNRQLQQLLEQVMMLYTAMAPLCALLVLPLPLMLSTSMATHNSNHHFCMATAAAGSSQLLLSTPNATRRCNQSL
jgi:hypothetical protein